MTWIENIVIGVIIILGLGILYKGLKEPIDLVAGLFKNAILWVIDKIRGTVPEPVYDTSIVYD